MPTAPAQLAVAAGVGPHDGRSYGQVIEYIENRLFLASYTTPPDDDTPFPYFPQPRRSSPSKRSSRQIQSASAGQTPLDPVYFSIDKTLLYNAFHADFGPLHIGHLYRFAVELHEVLGDPKNEGKVVVFWSHADSRSRANAACMLACYMVLIQSWPPHLALAPIAQMDPPLMPFRDAGYSQADFILSIQDVVYGVWKAKEEGICGLKDFNLEEYERFERVDMGDFNWVTPDFIAFASPQSTPTTTFSTSSPEFASLPRSTAAVLASDLPEPFKNVLAHFRKRHVGLVVRLNDPLYSASYFTALGIHHLDMEFEDGTCPPLSLVKKFIKIAHEMITVKHRGIAIHCKAGLGRTGCLIGAYLIYRYGFTASEVIAFMRFMRPGMVVGPQQHWLHLNQGHFRQWWFEDSIKDKLELLKQATPPRNRTKVISNGQTHTPPYQSPKRRALGELDDTNPRRSSGLGVHDENLPAPTPGQPRKTSKLYGERHNPYVDNENDGPSPQPESEVIQLERHLRAEGDGAESEEEQKLRMLAGTRTASRSPSGRLEKRTVSCTTAALKDGSWDAMSEEEASLPPKSPARAGSGVGTLAISKRGSPVRRSPERTGGVRKTSGRTPSTGTVSHAMRVKQ